MDEGWDRDAAELSFRFEWDDGNESEFARHHISPREVEQVFENEPVWAPNKRNRAAGSVAYGRTNGGRPLTIIVLVKADNLLRPITGWDMARGERTRYLR